MKFWKDLSFEKQIEILSSYEAKEIDRKAKACFFATSILLAGDEVAERMVWQPSVNDFLINSPEEMATYCRELAVIERRNTRLVEAIKICRQRLNDRHGTNMAEDIRSESVDDEGFHFSYKLWCLKERQTVCIQHSELPPVSVDET